MGITGLLPFLKSIQHPTHVSTFRNQTVVVDAYCWLHKGCYSCSLELIEGRDSEMRYVKYCMRKINMLMEHKVNVIMVFDGARLPSKKCTEEKRRLQREIFREKGMKLLREGKRKEAYDNFKHCVDVKPEFALNLINACRERGVQCIVAPYEADAQLAYMVRSGLAHAVISEDSDLLVFGCERVLFKMDDVGNGFLVNLNEVGNVKGHNMLGFGEDSFRHMCILSGCDYLDNIPGVGLITAHKLMRKYGFDPHKVIQALRFERGKSVPAAYEDNFKQADMTFLFQVVFDPRTECQVHLTAIPPEVESSALTYAGIQVTPNKAKAFARGNINPITNAVMGDYTPSKDKHSQQHQASVVSGAVEKHQKTMTSFFTSGQMRSSKRSREEEPELKPEVIMEQYTSFSNNVRQIVNIKTSLKSKKNIFSVDTSSDEKVCVYSRFFSEPSGDSFAVNEQPRHRDSKEVILPDLSKLRKLCLPVGDSVEVANSNPNASQLVLIESLHVSSQPVVRVNSSVEMDKGFSEKGKLENISPAKLDDDMSPDLLRPRPPPFVISPDLLANEKKHISHHSILLSREREENPVMPEMREDREESPPCSDSDTIANGKQITSKQPRDPFTTPSKDSPTLCVIPETPLLEISSVSKSDDSDIELSSIIQAAHSQPTTSHYFSKRCSSQNYRRPLMGACGGKPKRRPLTGSSRQLALDVFATKSSKN